MTDTDTWKHKHMYKLMEKEGSSALVEKHTKDFN